MFPVNVFPDPVNVSVPVPLFINPPVLVLFRDANDGETPLVSIRTACELFKMRSEISIVLPLENCIVPPLNLICPPTPNPLSLPSLRFPALINVLPV